MGVVTSSCSLEMTLPTAARLCQPLAGSLAPPRPPHRLPWYAPQPRGCCTSPARSAAGTVSLAAIHPVLPRGTR